LGRGLFRVTAVLVPEYSRRPGRVSFLNLNGSWRPPDTGGCWE